ncbi:MAG TPA: hypothetical protein VN914_01565, partial [Polyangia bacterium]|nr:hypothetical protein [Polyangia bacterium]
APAPLEVYRWGNAKGSNGPIDLAPGASTDFWTSQGFHYRFDGQQLGELSFKRQEPNRELRSVASDGGGGVLVVWEADKAVFLSRHDQDGRELWSTPMGLARRQIVKGGQAPNEIMPVAVTGGAADGTIHVSGWFQGCVDLAGGRQHRLVCATRRNSGEPTSPELDGYPRVFFVNQYDRAGAWKRALVFEKFPRGSAASSPSSAVAVTGRWYTSREVELRAPGGAPLLHVPAQKAGAPLKSVLGLFRQDGRTIAVTELDAARYTVVRSLSFDAADRLWLLVESSPRLDLKEAGQLRLTVPGDHCLALLSRSGSEAGWEKQLVECSSEADLFSNLLFMAPAADGRLILGNLPAEMAATVTLGSADGPEFARARRNLALMVLTNGRPSWSLETSGVNHAVALAEGWVCFTQLTRINCVRPAKHVAPAP